MAAAADRGGRLCSKSLFQVLTTPSKIANALDWKKPVGGSIATLSVQTDWMHLFLSSHPSTLPTTTTTNGETPVPTTSDYYSLPLRHQGRRHISPATRHQLSKIVLDHKVCGFIVCWPLQADTGRMGAACGRALFALEQLLQPPPQPHHQYPAHETPPPPVSAPSQLQSIFTPNRKLCFWDATSYTDAGPVEEDATPPPHHQSYSQQRRRRARPTFDLFGRSAVYAHTSKKEMYRASHEQYHQDKAINNQQVWNDFVQTCWPHLLVATDTVTNIPRDLFFDDKPQSQRQIQQHQRQRQRQHHKAVVQHNTTPMLEPPQHQQRRSRNLILS